jgi:predicted DCC family thiol-disulfide oxidoreductase YuxK
MSEASSPSQAEISTAGPGEKWQLKLLYDGRCQVCSREVQFMQRMAAKKQAPLAFADITAPDFDPGRYGKSLEELHRKMYAVRHDGMMIVGMEVFRQAYAILGMGWLFAWTRLPIAKQLSDVGYACFAAIRPHLPKRPGCDSGQCQVR